MSSPEVAEDSGLTDLAPIVVDDEPESELASIFGDSTSTSASLTSSILKYHYENGRRYHAYQQGRYLMPNDEKEQEHMDILGNMFNLVLGGKPFLAPIGDHPQRILDLGTGTGTWAIEVGDMFPSAQVIGNDLSPIQPSMVPPNVQFEVDDVESPWAHSSPFDFIHCRFLATSVKDWPKLVGQTLQYLKPDGYAEFYECDYIYKSDDGSLKKDHEMFINCSEVVRAAGILGQDACPGPKLKKWFEDAGFVNVTEAVFKIPIGPWAKDPRQKEIGAWNKLQAFEGVEGWTMALLTRVLGWPTEKVQLHLSGVRKDYRDPKIHAYMTGYVVYGQKAKESVKAAEPTPEAT